MRTVCGEEVVDLLLYHQDVRTIAIRDEMEDGEEEVEEADSIVVTTTDSIVDDRDLLLHEVTIRADDLV